MYFFYTFLVTLLLPVALVRLYFLGRKNPLYRKRWLERLGFLPFKLDNCVWFHCVSLGESIAATPLIKKLIALYGPSKLLITTTTPTGSDYVQKTFGKDIYHCYFPYDHPIVLRHFIQSVHPTLLILMETELWPQLLKILHAQKIPIVLTNARLSERSRKKYAYFGHFTTHMLRHLSWIASQTLEDAIRFQMLGMPNERIVVTGNIKYDAKIPGTAIFEAAQLKNGIWKDRLIWIAGSTHDGEEKIVLAAHRKILETYPQTLLILVPRHIDRTDQLIQLITEEGLSVKRRSLAGMEDTSPSQVYLGDTFGEMMLLYAASDVAFVGGSLIERGGHNLLEPASLEKPCLCGPHTFNFKQVTDLLLEAGALKIVHDEQDLAKTVLTLFKDPDQRKMMGAQGLKVVESNRGALEKQLAVIQKTV